jgi:hypothetical protein
MIRPTDTPCQYPNSNEFLTKGTPMRAVALLLLSLLVAACGGQPEPTPTPTKTPQPVAAATPVPSATPEPQADAATPTPGAAEQLGQAVADKLFDDAYQYVVVNGAAGATDDQLTAALIGLLRRLPATLERVRSRSVGQDDEILLDACHQVGFNLALRSKSIEAQNNLQTLADICTGLRLSAISGGDPSADLARLPAVLEFLAPLTAQ